jgi:hypothetical protein
MLYFMCAASRGISRALFTANNYRLGWKAANNVDFWNNVVMSVLFKLSPAITPAIVQICSLFSDINSIIFNVGFPSTIEEQAKKLFDTIVALNTALHGLEGIELTSNFHRIIHLPDLLRNAYQFHGVNTFKVCQNLPA